MFYANYVAVTTAYHVTFGSTKPRCFCRGCAVYFKIGCLRRSCSFKIGNQSNRFGAFTQYFFGTKASAGYSFTNLVLRCNGGSGCLWRYSAIVCFGRISWVTQNVIGQPRGYSSGTLLRVVSKVRRTFACITQSPIGFARVAQSRIGFTWCV